MERRLAAILAADVVGYTRLMGKEEVGTLRRLNSLRKDVLEPLIAHHRGRIVKLMGDGLLIEFSSVVDAVECAIAWQKDLSTAAEGVAFESRLQFRIGINLGDVIVEGEDIFGDGVNVAARLESLAEPGGICLSEDAHRQARGKVDAVFQDLGTQTLKNVAEPLRVFHIATTDDGPSATSGTAASFSPSGRPTLALVPFRHLGVPAQSYITEGLTESLSTALALFEEFAFIGSPAAEGHAPPTFLLEGSVQTSGNRARIGVQLSEAASGRKVWGKTLDHSADDVFAMQDEVVGIVASTMGEAIWEESARVLSDKSKDTFTPHDWTLDGMQHLHRADPEELRRGRASFQKALAMVPDLPLALLGIGWTYTTELVNGWPTDRPDAYDYCVALAKDLLRRNERYDQAHRLLGRLYHFAGMHDEALTHSRRAYEINPYNSDMIVSYGLSLIYTGETAEGVGYVERGCRINPYAPAYYQTYLALGYFLCGRYEDAVSRLRGLERPVASSRLFLAASLAALGRRSEAEAEVQAHLVEHPDANLEVVTNSIPLKEDRDRKAYVDALAKAGLPRGGRTDDCPTGEAALPLPDKPSVAVLPFENISGEPAHDALADGITEEIITTLSKVSKLFVIARNSTLVYKGRAVDIRQVGREQGVQYVLEGSVRSGGQRVRVTAQLIEIATGRHLWAQRYDRESGDIFALQDDVTKEIVSALQVELTAGEQAHLAAQGTRNAEAWQLTFEGRDLVHEHHKDTVQKGRSLLDQALRLDENYAMAWGALAEARWKEARNEGWSASPERSLELSLEASDRALALDPANAGILAMRSVIMTTLRDFDGALALAEKALRLAHSDANAIALAAITLYACGKAKEAIKQTELAMRHCPRYPPWYLLMLARCRWMLGESEEAIAASRSAIEADPLFAQPYIVLAMVHAEAGELSDAREAVRNILRIDPKFSARAYLRGLPLRNPTQEDRRRAALQIAGLPD